jgi:hypothetical protein
VGEQSEVDGKKGGGVMRKWGGENGEKCGMREGMD